MAMSLRSRRALGKGRELLWFLLRHRVCYFCYLPIVPPETKRGDGDGRGLPVPVETITIHHEDGDHYNDKEGNGHLAHQKCHQRFNLWWVVRKHRGVFPKRMAAKEIIRRYRIYQKECA